MMSNLFNQSSGKSHTLIEQSDNIVVHHDDKTMYHFVHKLNKFYLNQVKTIF